MKSRPYFHQHCQVGFFNIQYFVHTTCVFTMNCSGKSSRYTGFHGGEGQRETHGPRSTGRVSFPLWHLSHLCGRHSPPHWPQEQPCWPWDPLAGPRHVALHVLPPRTASSVDPSGFPCPGTLSAPRPVLRLRSGRSRRGPVLSGPGPPPH